MKRARVGPLGVPRPVLFLLVAGLAVGACGAPAGSVAPALGTPTESSAAPSVATSSPSAAVTASGRAASPSSTAPSPRASATSSPRAGGRDSVAGACSGSADTRDFFTAIAEAVSWSVYCAVLPAGWSVEAGQYRLANGGQMVISYRTNAGGHLQIQEGRWCTGGASACSPHDSVVGTAVFGDLDGQLERLDGDLVLYVSPGQAASWTATGHGLDEATFRSLCDALRLVRA